MKKKALFVAVVFVCIATFANAQYLFDLPDGDIGFCYATYKGTTRTVDINKVCESERQEAQNADLIYQGSCTKLTRQESYLLWRALGKYNYRDNEVYTVYINTSFLFSRSPRMLILVVVITNGGHECNWYDVGYWKLN